MGAFQDQSLPAKSTSCKIPNETNTFKQKLLAISSLELYHNSIKRFRQTDVLFPTGIGELWIESHTLNSERDFAYLQPPGFAVECTHV